MFSLLIPSILWQSLTVHSSYQCFLSSFLAHFGRASLFTPPTSLFSPHSLHSLAEPHCSLRLPVFSLLIPCTLWQSLTVHSSYQCFLSSFLALFGRASLFTPPTSVFSPHSLHSLAEPHCSLLLPVFSLLIPCTLWQSLTVHSYQCFLSSTLARSGRASLFTPSTSIFSPHSLDISEITAVLKYHSFLLATLCVSVGRSPSPSLSLCCNSPGFCKSYIVILSVQLVE